MKTKMTQEMIDTAFELFKIAEKYKQLAKEQGLNEPVVWIKNEEKGSTIFISDGFNAERIKAIL